MGLFATTIATPQDVSAGRVGPADRAKLGAGEVVALAAVGLACVAFGLIRQACNDIGWHLATARLAEAAGGWPTTNSFSHTWPEYPLAQQYPLFQAVLLGIYHAAGWSGLSLLNAAGWLGVLLLFMRWGGRWRRTAWLHLPWMVGLMALQRRMILRPDLFSMLLLAAELLVIDCYLAGDERAGDGRRNRRAAWLLLLPALQWLWANSHQLYPLGLAVQGLLLGHLVLARWGRCGVDRGSAGRPLLPVLGAGVLSAGACLLTPLGTGIVHVIANTSGSLAHHRGDVQEFARLWQRPWELQLAVACGVLGAAGLWRMRRCWRLVDVGLWCGALVMTLAAVRGLVFFGPVSVAIFARSFRTVHTWPPQWLGWPAVRVATVAATLVLAGNVVFHRWVAPPPALGGTQPGLGRSLGDWPDGAVAFLRTHPPPGRMLNLPWSLGSPLIWELPDQPVFVDARLEAYPRDFLVECMAAERDDAVLARQIERDQPGWIIANHRDADVRARALHLLAGGAWACVHADTLTLVLVRESPENQRYLADRRLTAADLAPHDLLAAPEALRALQRAHFDTLRKELAGLPSFAR